jgi:hypothetical protein
MCAKHTRRHAGSSHCELSRTGSPVQAFAEPMISRLLKTCLGVAPPMVGVERVLEGDAEDDLILPCDKPFPECSNAACVRRGGHNDDLRLAQSLHFSGDFIQLLLGIHNRIGKQMNRRLRDSQVAELRGSIPLHRQTGCRISASRRQDLAVGSPILRARSPLGRVSRLPRPGYGMIPLRTTIASAEESVSSRTSHRPALRAAITTARVRSRQTDKYMNQRAFFAAFGLTISSSFKASLGIRDRRPNRTQKLNQLRGRRRFPG